MSVDNSKCITSKPIAYNDLTLWNCIKTYSNIFSTYKGNRLQGGSLLCYVFMSAFVFLRQKWWTLSSCRTFIISIGLDEKSAVRYWCISVTSKISTCPCKRTCRLCLSVLLITLNLTCFRDKKKVPVFQQMKVSTSLSASQSCLVEGCWAVNCTLSCSTCSGVSSRGVSYYGNDLVNPSHHKCILSWSPSLPLWWCHLYRPSLQGWPCSHSHISGWHQFFFIPGCLSMLEWKLVWEGRSGKTFFILPVLQPSCRGRLAHIVSKPYIPSEKGLRDWRITKSKWHHLPWCGLVVVTCERKLFTI